MQINYQETIRIHTSTQKNRFKAVVSRTHVGEQERTFLDYHKEHIVFTSGVGSSLKGCIIAAGFADVYVRYGPTSEWDIAAMDIIVHEAGGVLRDMHHQMLQYRKTTAANPYFYILNQLENQWLIDTLMH